MQEKVINSLSSSMVKQFLARMMEHNMKIEAGTGSEAAKNVQLEEPLGSEGHKNAVWTLLINNSQLPFPRPHTLDPELKH